MLQAFLVDDEEHSLNLLELFLTRIGGVNVIGRSNNGFDTLHQLSTLQPDVIFLDIEMPEMNGLELSECIRASNWDIQIVFVTAYDQYAITAFEHAAMDYILKPLEMERLTKTVMRIQKENDKPLMNSLHAGQLTGIDYETPSVTKLNIQLFGVFNADNEFGMKLKSRTSKEKELLAYLSLQHNFRVHRDQIIEDLWPFENYDKAKVYLHTCISLLRKNLKALQLDHILKYENERYYLDASRVNVDVTRFKQLTTNVIKDHIAIHELEKVLNYCKGSLLSEEDYVWAGQEAEALDKSVGEWRITLAEKYCAVGKYEKSIQLAEQSIENYMYDERAYRLMMKGYHRMGENDQVHLIYNKLINRLDELQIKPSDVTLHAYEEICK